MALVEDKGLQKIDRIIVNVHVGEETLEDHVHDVPRGEQFIQAFRVRSPDEIPFRLRLLPVYMF